MRADKAAHAFDKRVKQVNATYVDHDQAHLRWPTPTAASPRTPRTSAASRVHVVAEGKKRRAAHRLLRRRRARVASATSTPSRRSTWRARRRARRSPRWARWTRRPGQQTVVLAPGWSGILLHEAVGHGLEADFIRKSTSLFAGKLGQKVASRHGHGHRRRHGGQRARLASTSTTRATRASARCSSRTACSRATCTTRSTRS